MPPKRPILVLGFGRSGTTWASDILSKSLGQVILFEPFHPCVFDAAHSFCYLDQPNQDQETKLINFFDLVVSKKILNRWLMRNHLNAPLEELSDDFVAYVWENMTVCGFKSIRQNFNLLWWHKVMDAKILYIIRHPLAVISSILRRPRFFQEFGWHFHWDTFLKHTSKHYPNVVGIKSIADNCKTIEQKIAYMWCMTNAVAIRNLGTLSLEPVFYETLYRDPYAEAKKWLTKLGIQQSIHPSYLFTPSMLTMKTVHPLAFHQNKTHEPNVFWVDHLDKRQIDDIYTVILRFNDFDPAFSQMIYNQDYLL